MNMYQYLTSMVAEGNSKTFFIILAFIICVIALYIYFHFFAADGIAVQLGVVQIYVGYHL